MPKRFLIITAAGIGTRMPTDKPKQFTDLGNQQPVLLYTLKQCYQALDFDDIVLTLPEQYQAFWQSISKQWDVQIPHRVVTGGSERADSVKAALDSLKPDEQKGLVGIHDGVRPFLSADLVQRTFQAATDDKGVIPVISPGDSLRIQENDKWHPLERSRVRRVQTPQVFDLHKIWKAYQLVRDKPSTDDAQIWENAGHELTLVDGETGNFKLTTATDLAYAHFLSNMEQH